MYDEPFVCLLEGLRMSQFSEDKDGTPSDPTQKTLSNFIMTGDATGSNMDDHTSFGSDLKDEHFRTQLKAGLPIDNHELCHSNFRDPLESSEISDASNSNCIFSYDGEMKKCDGALNNKSKAKVCAFY